MCRRVRCTTCGRPTYKGCGNHIEQVLGDVPSTERCTCADERRRDAAARPKRTWFRRNADASR